MQKNLKDSGVDWIGEIPSEWNVVRAKTIFTNHKTIAGNKSSEYERLALTLKGVIKRSKDDSTGLQPEAFDGYQVLNPGELVFKLIDLENLQTSRVGLSPYCGIVSPAYIILTPDMDKVVPEFAEMYFLSMWQRAIFNHMGDDGVRSSLSSKDLLNVPIVLPSKETQIKISSFLKKRQFSIDRIISEMTQSINDYKKLKQSIIIEATTKGIRKNREMKDSNIEWIGDIPADWKVERHKNVMHKSKDICNYYDGEDIISLTMNGVVIRDLDAGGKMPTSFDGYQYVQPGDLLLCLFDVDVTPRCVGLVKNHGITSPAYSRFIIHNGYLNRYYDYLLRGIDDNKSFLHLAKNLRSSFTEEDFGAIHTVVPPFAEQLEIANYLDDKLSKIDSLIAKKENVISELENYKKSIIYEYITGKKEVPEL